MLQNKGLVVCVSMAVLMTLGSASGADVIRYRPSPFHGEDNWASSVAFPGGVNDQQLVVGGNGNDYYRFLLKFPRLEGLPQNVSEVVLFLRPYSPGNGSTPTSMNPWALSSPWNESTGWNDPLFGANLGSLPAPTPGTLYGINVTSFYNAWRDGSFPNQGFGFLPTGAANQFNYFRSSDYDADPSHRPYLRITATAPVQPLSLKLPLPGGRSWIINTEVGAYDCATPQSLSPNYSFPSHQGINYFSIDIGPKALLNGQTTTYTTVPIYAAAAGRVVIAGSNPFNGNHVVIDHDFDGNVNTGFQTRYLHFQSLPAVSVGQTVTQGQRLGYMGDTGQANGVHLHFGVRYRDYGGSDEEALTFVQVDGIYLKAAMTECNGSARIMYYPSTNPSTSLQ